MCRDSGIATLKASQEQRCVSVTGTFVLLLFRERFSYVLLNNVVESCDVMQVLGCAWQVYHLASVRLRDLCDRLEIDSELCSKIWTCFEHSLINHIDLMQDRHLDQMIMCAVYVICKVSKDFHSDCARSSYNLCSGNYSPDPAV